MAWQPVSSFDDGEAQEMQRVYDPPASHDFLADKDGGKDKTCITVVPTTSTTSTTFFPGTQDDNGRFETGVDHESMSSFSRVTRNTWFWEILASLASIGCMTAIAGVLFRFDHNPLPSWPLGITLNALISLLATMGKAAMLVVVGSCISQLKWRWFDEARTLKDFEMFDEASRGPLGSLFLLTSTKPMHLASAGAVLMVVAVALDPFVQQIVGYVQRPVEAFSASAWSFRAQGYDSGLVENSGLQVGPESGMKSAIYSGLFRQATLSDPAPFCATSNCSMPIFTSLAVCGQCLNVTDQVKMVAIRSLGQDNNTSGGVLDVDVYNITYALPGAVEMTISFDMSTAPTEGDGSDLVYGPAMLSQADLSNAMTHELFNVSQSITALSILQFPYVNFEGTGGDYTSGMPFAWECALYFCINTYNQSVRNGNVSTSIVSSWHDPMLAPVDEDGDVDGTLVLPRNQLNDNDSTTKHLTFPVPEDTLYVLSAYLNYTLAGEILTDFTEVSAGTYVDDVLQVLNVTEDIGAVFDNIATSMTSYIRSQNVSGPTSSSLNSTTRIFGTAYVNTTLVHVNWAWFALPMLLIGLTLFLLGATAAASTKREGWKWKSSSLATLYHGLESQDRTRGLNHPAVMDMRAKKTKVVLRMDGQGNWGLVPATRTGDAT